MPHMTFEEYSDEVAPGDTLFVYTDGLTDRRNAEGEFYSIDRVATLLETRDAGIAAVYVAIFNDISSFPSTEEFKDDIAFVVTRFH